MTLRSLPIHKPLIGNGPCFYGEHTGFAFSKSYTMVQSNICSGCSRGVHGSLIALFSRANARLPLSVRTTTERQRSISFFSISPSLIMERIHP